MGLENFNPKIWSAKLFVRLRKALVFGNIVNTEYEGEISQFGDTVHINEIGPITVSDYTKYGALSWQALTSAQKTLIIDQAQSFSFAVDDIDTAQMKPKIMNDAMSEASYAVADKIDQFIASLYSQAAVVGSAGTVGTSSTSLAVSSGNVIETISYASRYLSEANVPEALRWIVISPWVHQKLLLAEVGGVSATAVPKVTTQDAIPGFVGEALGFKIYVSNNVSNDGTQYRIMAGIKNAITYAGQISKVKPVEREDYFDQGIKGLYLYGGKVVRPNALITLYLSETAG
ncbi:MAG: P22 phage major capsid protein family protein [Candidatus Nanoarchaeia archaeon]|nr:P22 phage major capsid protein family protein [Candidatus Nanoarchaeia archaeon]